MPDDQTAETKPQRKPRKPRASSKFLLLGVLMREDPSEPVRLEVLARCTSVKACRTAALSDDVEPGDFVVACVRDEFPVAMKKLKLIERKK